VKDRHNATDECILQSYLGDMHIAVSSEIILLVVKFKVYGSLRFISHAQTVRLFQRACVRAGIKIQYSRGFNPRPKLSLPLPRPVGITSEDELMCIRVSRTLHEPPRADYESRIKDRLSAQLPEGCELLAVNVAKADMSFQPCAATYVFTVRKEYLNERLKSTIERLLASESLNIRRMIKKRKSRIKNLNVRGFLKSIELDKNNIIVDSRISSTGSIRVEEIMELLELDMEKMVLPIRRTSLMWHEA